MSREFSFKTAALLSESEDCFVSLPNLLNFGLINHERAREAMRKQTVSLSSLIHELETIIILANSHYFIKGIYGLFIIFWIKISIFLTVLCNEMPSMGTNYRFIRKGVINKFD